MTAVHRLSSQVIDYAERLAAVADAAQGKHSHRSRATRWLLLPASGAALYAFVRSDSFSRQAKEVVDEAKTRASELPEDLVARVRETTGGTTKRSSGQNGRSRPAARKTSSSRTTSGAKRKASSAR
jgi:hypothetical protein